MFVPMIHLTLRIEKMPMNSQDLMLKAIRGEPVPRVPCGPLATFFCAADAGVSVLDFSQKPGVQVECILRYYEKYRPDAVWISADTWVTAQAMGAPVFQTQKNQPLAGSPDGFVSRTQDLARIPKPDPYTRGRQPLLLETVSRVAEELGREVFVVGCFDQSPFSLACQALGLANMMTRIMEDRPFVEALLETCLEHSTAYAEAMAACGADMLSTGDSPASLIGPDLYGSLALPWEKRLFARLDNTTDSVLSLHICGDTSAILDAMAQSEAHVLEIDHFVDLDYAFGKVEDRVALWGNIDPVGVLLNGNTTLVKQKAQELLGQARAHPSRRFVLSSSCTLAPDTPPENLFALLEAARC